MFFFFFFFFFGGGGGRAGAGFLKHIIRIATQHSV